MINRTRRQYLFSVFLTWGLSCFVSQSVSAGKIYQWVDEAGNVNFSDVPPNGSVTTDMREINISPYDVGDIDLEQYSIINQVEQMTQWRRQLTEERLAERMLDIEEKRLANELEFNRRNEAIVAQEYRPRAYIYSPYPFPQQYHGQHGVNRHPHKIQTQPFNVPSRRNIIPRKYGPVHL